MFRQKHFTKASNLSNSDNILPPKSLKRCLARNPQWLDQPLATSVLCIQGGGLVQITELGRIEMTDCIRSRRSPGGFIFFFSRFSTAV